MNISPSTSSISSSNSASNNDFENKVLGDGSASIQKAGFYDREGSFLIDEGFNFIITEANEKFILGFDNKETVLVSSAILNKENIR